MIYRGLSQNVNVWLLVVVAAAVGGVLIPLLAMNSRYILVFFKN